MSQGIFREAIRRKIIDTATEAIKKYTEQNGPVTKQGKLTKETGLRTDNIRARTNKASEGYQSVITRGGLIGLADDFLALQTGINNFAKASELLKRPLLYDGFKAYIINMYGVKKEDTFENIRSRTTTRYEYQVIDTGKGKIRIGSSKENTNEKDIMILKNLNHGEFKSIFVDYLKNTYPNDSDIIAIIDKNLNAGHLAGVFDIRVREIFDLRVGVSTGTYRDFTVTAGEDQELNNTFNAILKLIHDADYITSNIVYDLNLFTSMVKDVHGPANSAKVSAILQLGILNREAGRALSDAGQKLSNLIVAVDVKAKNATSIDNTAATTAVDGLINALLPVVKVIQDTGQRLQKTELDPSISKIVTDILTDTKSIKTMIEERGSPSVIESIRDEVIAAISGDRKPSRQITKVVDKQTKKVAGAKGKSKTSAPQVPKPNSKSVAVKKVDIVSKVKQQSLDTTSLKSLLDANLVETIKRNMGSGSRKDILNLRSGRFAESVRVETLSASRNGAITAFYSYMRNPYATFSQGGKQQYPRTRDPKLLISKSIRQIAQQLKIQQLRAVEL